MEAAAELSYNCPYRQTKMSDDLQGWKEIAQHLGKSVRAVQRWEAELGLPVHRLKTGDGQSVFARRSEIEAWRRHQELPPKPQSGTGEASPQVPTGAPPVAASGRTRLFYVGTAVVVCATLAAVALQTSEVAVTSGSIAYALDVDSLVASRGGREVWRHRFRRKLVLERPIGHGFGSFPVQRVHHADIDGDGADEVLVAVSYPSTPVLETDELHAFSSDGETKWIYRPDLTLRFRAGDFGPPWLISSVAVLEGDGRDDVYVALTHNTWWPSAIVRLRSDGSSETRLVHSGHLYALHASDVGGARRLFAGGINNQYGAAAAVVMEGDGPAARSPQTEGSKFECLDCGSTPPARYFVFEPNELTRSGDAVYNRLVNLTRIGDSIVLMVVDDPNVVDAQVFFRISPTLQPIVASPTDGYWREHRRRHELGRLTHTAEECPEQRRLVRVFDSVTGWNRRDLPIEAAVPGDGRASR